MDTTTSPRETDEVGGLFSCWGRLKLKLPWKRRRIGGNSNKGTRQRSFWPSVGCNSMKATLIGANMNRKPKPKPAGGFNYDPLSYAQNFDDGCWDDDYEDSTYRGFSSRFPAAPSSTRAPLEDVK